MMKGCVTYFKGFWGTIIKILNIVKKVHEPFLFANLCFNTEERKYTPRAQRIQAQLLLLTSFSRSSSTCYIPRGNVIHPIYIRM